MEQGGLNSSGFDNAPVDTECAPSIRGVRERFFTPSHDLGVSTMMRELRRCSLEEIEADLCSDPSEDDFATERPGRQSADPAKLFVRSWQRHVAPKLDCLLDQLEQDALASSLALVQVCASLVLKPPRARTQSRTRRCVD